ncbi:MAG: hypothetical protein JSR43_00505 [Proteobacteria bacterium]|nr:hypothetical protein [Pseudomonadota bacterium]
MMVRSGVSRWTMAHFALSLVALVLAQLLFVFGYSDLQSGLRAPATLIGVHLTTIGWLSLLMLGALYQFAPVITNTRLYSQRLPLYALVSIVAGLGAMVLGFLALAGSAGLAVGWLPVGGALVLAGFALGAADLWITLWPVRPLPLAAVFVVCSLAFLLLTGLIGLGFALTFALPQPSAFLGRLTGAGLELHLAAGLGGWFTLTMMGVSYRLLTMFMLAPDAPRRTTYAALVLSVSGLLLLIAVQVAGIWTGVDVAAGAVVAAVLIAAGVACYLADIVRFYRTRARRHLELNSVTAGAALALFALALVAGLAAAALGVFGRFAGTIVYLFVFGGLTGLGLSQLYKIIPFLTWLEKFGPKLGKGPVLRVQDLVNERRARPWFVLYFVAVLLASGCLAFGQTTGWRVAAGLQLVATLLIVAELWRSRHPDPNLEPKPMQVPGLPARPVARGGPAGLERPTPTPRSTT